MSLVVRQRLIGEGIARLRHGHVVGVRTLPIAHEASWNSGSKIEKWASREQLLPPESPGAMPSSAWRSHIRRVSEPHGNDSRRTAAPLVFVDQREIQRLQRAVDSTATRGRWVGTSSIAALTAAARRVRRQHELSIPACCMHDCRPPNQISRDAAGVDHQHAIAGGRVLAAVRASSSCRESPRPVPPWWDLGSSDGRSRAGLAVRRR